MDKDRDILRRIEALPQPRHLFVLPEWVEPSALDRLTNGGYVHCQYQQRDEKGEVLMAMNVKLTPKADRLLRPQAHWSQLAFTGSLAGASFAAISVLILYLG